MMMPPFLNYDDFFIIVESSFPKKREDKQLVFWSQEAFSSFFEIISRKHTNVDFGCGDAGRTKLSGGIASLYYFFILFYAIDVLNRGILEPEQEKFRNDKDFFRMVPAHKINSA